jgi:adenylate cyclase
VTEHGNREAVHTHLAYEEGRRKENLEERLYSRTLVSKALESKTGFIFDRDESGTMSEADQSSSIFQLHIKTALCCPIHSEGRVFGVIYLDGKKSGQKFTTDDLELVMHVAGIAGMAIENIELYRKLRSEVRIREHLRRFVSPNVAEKIIAERGGGDFHLISQRTPVSVLFADIRGFTRISESLPPLTVARILNAFFSRMSEVVFRNGGTLDKFVGDSLMVLFNAPVLHPDHEMAAVKTAVEMRRHLREMLPEWKAQGLPEIHMGIGINSGEAVAGSIGTDERMEYTAIGDTVNTAARVCGIAKPDQILVTGNVYEKLPVEFKAAPLGPVQLKGKSQPVPLFEIVED